MSSAPAPEEIASDARWLAQALEPARGLARLVAMDRESYRAASFLDDRLLQSPVDEQIIAWPELAAAVEGDRRSDARWIFHIGHVGSTLVSRLLGELQGVLAIREPRLLRDLALLPIGARRKYIRPVPKLMSRTFAAEELACIKVTSFASEMAAELVPPGERALFLYVQPQKYVGTILAGENSLGELQALEQYRAQRLASRGIHFGALSSNAHRAAAAWACEMTSLESAAEAMDSQHVEWTDFDDLLADLPGKLGQISTFFQIEAAKDELETIASGPLVMRYSKDPNFNYSPELRRAVIDQELDLQRAEIEDALAMLAAASERSSLLARALRRGERN